MIDTDERVGFDEAGDILSEHRRLRDRRRVEDREAAATEQARDRIRHLLPNRYFRFYMIYDKESRISCWIPEGFLS